MRFFKLLTTLVSVFVFAFIFTGCPGMGPGDGSDSDTLDRTKLPSIGDVEYLDTGRIQVTLFRSENRLPDSYITPDFTLEYKVTLKASGEVTTGTKTLYFSDGEERIVVVIPVGTGVEVELSLIEEWYDYSNPDIEPLVSTTKSFTVSEEVGELGKSFEIAPSGAIVPRTIYYTVPEGSIVRTMRSDSSSTVLPDGSSGNFNGTFTMNFLVDEQSAFVDRFGTDNNYLVPGTGYRVILRQYYTFGDYGDSDSSGYFYADVYGSLSENVALDAGDANEQTLSWSPVPDATSYAVHLEVTDPDSRFSGFTDTQVKFTRLLLDGGVWKQEYQVGVAAYPSGNTPASEFLLVADDTRTYNISPKPTTMVPDFFYQGAWTLDTKSLLYKITGPANAEHQQLQFKANETNHPGRIAFWVMDSKGNILASDTDVLTSADKAEELNSGALGVALEYPLFLLISDAGTDGSFAVQLSSMNGSITVGVQ